MTEVEAARIELRIVSEQGHERCVRWDGEPLLWVGREASCDVVLASPDVSRRHLRLERTPSGILLEDRSANGTFLGSERLHRDQRLLMEASPIRVGPFTLHLSANAWSKQNDSDAASPQADEGATPELRRRVHRQLLEHLDLGALDAHRFDAEALRPRVVAALRRIVSELHRELPQVEARENLIKELTDEALGLGPLETLLADREVGEIMVVDPRTVYVERDGRIEATELRFTDDDATRAVIERIVTPLGRRIDESTPMVDARLQDGSRVHAVVPPLALRGPCITIRRFPDRAPNLSDLVSRGSLTPRMARFLERAVKARKNLVIAGGTGSGKTTLLNVLSAAIPHGERIITIEDAAELRLAQPHVVALESRPPNLEGKGAFTIRDLLHNALRMRPDRIIVGECRGGETLDMMQAMNTGHEGSMTTVHANSPRETLARLETLCLMAGLELPVRAIRMQLSSSLHLVLQQHRFVDGTRRITRISEVGGIDDFGDVELHDIFVFERQNTRDDGTIRGEHRATGYLPACIEDFLTHGLAEEGDVL